MKTAPIPQARLEEMREALLDRRDSYSRGPDDVSRDTGVTVQHDTYGGGCGEPTTETYTVKDGKGAEINRLDLKNRPLGYSSGEVTVNSDGSRVVGEFSMERSAWRDSGLLAKARRNGLELQDDRKEHYYLAEVPVPGGVLGAVPGYLRRKGWIQPKVLARLPDHVRSFDMGPSGNVAIAHGQQVLGWDRRQGLHPWLQFDREVQEVEFLSDGGLAARLEHRDFHGACDAVYLAPGASQPVEVPFKEFQPEQYESKLREFVQGVDFLRRAGVAEIERFMEDSRWLRSNHWWTSHEALANPADPRQEVVLTGDGSGQVWLYDHDSARARRLGPLNHPDIPDSVSSIRSASSSAQFKDGGRFLVYQGKLGALSSLPDSGEWTDLVVWDLQKGTQALVPCVAEVEWTETSVKYRPVGGEGRETALADLGALREEGWYKKAVVRDLLDSRAEDPGTIQEEETRVVVGGIELPRRGNL